MSFWIALYHLIAKHLPKSYGSFGNISKKIRYICASHFVKAIGRNVNIERGAFLSKSLSIGDNSSIDINALIQSEVYFGSNIRMSPDCMIFTTNHRFDEAKCKSIGNTPVNAVIIEDNVLDWCKGYYLTWRYYRLRINYRCRCSCKQ